MGQRFYGQKKISIMFQQRKVESNLSPTDLFDIKGKSRTTSSNSVCQKMIIVMNPGIQYAVPVHDKGGGFL